MIFIAVKASHPAHKHSDKSVYLQDNNSQLEFLTGRIVQAS